MGLASPTVTVLAEPLHFLDNGRLADTLSSDVNNDNIVVMSSARSQRTWLRTIHLTFGGCLGATVYLPTAWVDPVRPLLALVVVPALVLSGLAMWQWPRLRRLHHARQKVTSA